MRKLLSPFVKGALQLKNHVVMAPMTRSRALNNLPNELMAAYYQQRSGAGLLITEGTSPSPEGLGYPRIPGHVGRTKQAFVSRIAAAEPARCSRHSRSTNATKVNKLVQEDYGCTCILT
jgi:N-ethylmaleimide reductase